MISPDREWLHRVENRLSTTASPMALRAGNGHPGERHRTDGFDYESEEADPATLKS
jgi:hypothetical protein